MITDQDITKLKKVFATKEDLSDLALEMGEFKDSVEEKLTNIDVKLDRFLGRMDSLDTDSAVGTVVQYRHTRHIQALADHVGFTLPEE